VYYVIVSGLAANIPVDKKTKSGSINQHLSHINMEIRKEHTIRFHRSSKIKVTKDGSKVSQCLVKLRSWDKRVELHSANYLARVKDKTVKAGETSVRVYHDLTKRCLTVLNQARDMLGKKATKDLFVSADINSSLQLHKNKKWYSFNTMDEFVALFDEHVGAA
jgi:hypothetical protein